MARNREELRVAIEAKHPEVEFINPRIRFIGLWDTVPGLQFTSFASDTNLKAKDDRERYKVRPYPNIDIIGHALALDERRKDYRPLLVGNSLSKKTTVYEVWFPGAHSDVGGGYKDSNDLPGLSFNWMDRIMKKHGVVPNLSECYSDSTSIRHLPERSNVFRFLKNESRYLPQNSVIHESVFTRVVNSSATKMRANNEGELEDDFYRRRIQAASATGGGWFEELKISTGVFQSRRFLGRLLSRSSTR